MASPFPVHQLLDRAPDFNKSVQQGYQYGQQQADSNALRKLAPGVLAGDPAAYQQSAAIDPAAAKATQGAGDAQLRRLSGAIKYLDQAKASQNPMALQSAWREVAPFIGQVTGKQMPPEYPMESESALEQLKVQIAMAESGGGAAGGSVQSTYVDNQGNKVALMRDGTTQNLGPAQPQNQIVGVMQPDGSIQYQAINRGVASPYATPVTAGAPPAAGGYATPAPQPAPGTRQITDFRATDDATGQVITDPAELAEIQAAIERDRNGGNQIATPQVLTGAAKPSEPEKPSALQERIATARALGATEDELQRMVIGREGAAAGAKPLPAAALRLQLDAQEALATAATVDSTVDSVINQIDTGSLQLGPLNNMTSTARNYLNQSTPESRNYATFKSSMEKMRNDILMMHKGVQTEGDATRAMNAILANPNDARVVRDQMIRLKALNQRAVRLQQRQLDTIDQNYGRNGGGSEATAEGDIDSLLEKYR